MFMFMFVWNAYRAYEQYRDIVIAKHLRIARKNRNLLCYGSYSHHIIDTHGFVMDLNLYPLPFILVVFYYIVYVILHFADNNLFGGS